MMKTLLSLTALVIAHGANAQVRTSTEAFQIRSPEPVLPVVPFAKPEQPRAAPAIPVAAPPLAPAPASVAPVVVPAHAAPAQTWEVRTSDMRIDRTLERWAQAAGWRLQWDAARHVEIGAPTAFTGSFESAVKAILSSPGIRLSEFPLEGCIYPNQPPLLRITRQGEQVAECPTEFQE